MKRGPCRKGQSGVGASMARLHGGCGVQHRVCGRVETIAQGERFFDKAPGLYTHIEKMA